MKMNYYSIIRIEKIMTETIVQSESKELALEQLTCSSWEVEEILSSEIEVLETTREDYESLYQIETEE